ncbi:MAG: helix-turn-helix domain-containing protein [Streptosporangiales bacterium]
MPPRKQVVKQDRRPLADPDQVAEYLRVPRETLAQWRWLRRGPRYSKVGRHIRYAWADVDAWVDGQTQQTAAV